jgi:uncharacterized membrane protein YjjB (DUF3815 family)
VAGQQQVLLRPLGRGGINMSRLADLAALRAAVRAGQVDAAGGLRRLDQIGAPSAAGSPLHAACSFALLSLAMSVMLGGGWRELLAATLAGCAAGLVTALCRPRFAGPAMAHLFAATAATVVGIATSLAIGPFSTTIVVAAAFIPLVPAAEMLTGFLEIGHQRTLAGVERLCDAGVTLLALVSGVALGSVLIGIAPGLLAPVAAVPVPPWMQLLAFGCFVVAWAIVNHARQQDLGWIAVSCGLGQLVATVGGALPNAQLATFLGALVIGTAAHGAARHTGLPAGLLAIPGIILLLPGALAFSGALRVLGPNAGEGVQFVMQTALILLLLAAGLTTAEVVFGPRRPVQRA